MKNTTASLIIPTCLTLFLCAVTAFGTSISAYKWEVIQGLAQSSDAVISGRILDVQRGTRGGVQSGGSYSSSTDTRVKCAVERVHIGAPEMKGQTITILFTAGDSPIRKASDDQVLLFLKKERDSHRLPFWGRYGVFPLDGETVQCWLEGKPHGEFFTLREVIAAVRQYRQNSVNISAKIENPATPGGGVLRVTYTFRNSGSSPVYVVPPSHCFNSVQCRKLSKGQWFPNESPWRSVKHWDFLPAPEPLLRLPEKTSKVFRYKIPFTTLGIDTNATYRITSWYRPYRHSKWSAQETETIDHADTWLGVPDKQSWETEIGYQADRIRNK